MDFTGFSSFLRNKCTAKNITFTGAGNFFDDSLLSQVEKSWNKSLGDIVPELPDFNLVLRELRGQVANLFA